MAAAPDGFNSLQQLAALFHLPDRVSFRQGIGMPRSLPMAVWPYVGELEVLYRTPDGNWHVLDRIGEEETNQILAWATEKITRERTSFDLVGQMDLDRQEIEEAEYARFKAASRQAAVALGLLVPKLRSPADATALTSGPTHYDVVDLGTCKLGDRISLGLLQATNRETQLPDHFLYAPSPSHEAVDYYVPRIGSMRDEMPTLVRALVMPRPSDPPVTPQVLGMNACGDPIERDECSRDLSPWKDPLTGDALQLSAEAQTALFARAAQDVAISRAEYLSQVMEHYDRIVRTVLKESLETLDHLNPLQYHPRRSRRLPLSIFKPNTRIRLPIKSPLKPPRLRDLRATSAPFKAGRWELVSTSSGWRATVPSSPAPTRS
jgi:hypothetical protein